jgi:hypothetical protein
MRLMSGTVVLSMAVRGSEDFGLGELAFAIGRSCSLSQTAAWGPVSFSSFQWRPRHRDAILL